MSVTNIVIRCAMLCGLLAAGDNAAFGRPTGPNSGTDYGPLQISIEQMPIDARRFVRAPWSPGENPNTLLGGAEPLGQLLPDIFGEKWGSNAVCNSQFGITSEFANLVGKSNQLIALVNDTGRFCNLLIVVDKTSSGLIIGRLSVWQLDDLSKIFYRTGGSTLLAVSQPWSDYDGANSCLATWPFLYAFRGGKFVDVSSAAPDFYVKTLKEHEQALAATPKIDLRYDCLLMETQRLHRILNSASSGELELAISWSKSPDLFRRSKAIYMLSDVGGSAALSALAPLTGDKDSVIADFARREQQMLTQ